MSHSIFDPHSDGEWEEWLSMTATERMIESNRLLQHYILCGGSLDPEPDSQSPFDPNYVPYSVLINGGAGLQFPRDESHNS